MRAVGSKTVARLSIGLAVALFLCPCHAQPYTFLHPLIVPDASLTPGSIFTNLDIKTLCTPGYANVWHGGVRNVPEKLKKQAFLRYFGRLPNKEDGPYEVDHLIPLCLGGDNSISNLWPMPYNAPAWGAHVKDKAELRCYTLVKQELKAHGTNAATALLHQFQHDMALNWTNCYVRVIGQP